MPADLRGISGRGRKFCAVTRTACAVGVVAAYAGRMARTSNLALALVLGACGAAPPAAPEVEARAPRTADLSSPPATAVDEAAGAAFAEVELRPGELASMGLAPSAPRPTMALQLEDLVARIRAARVAAEQLAARFDPVIALGSARWSIAAYVRQGQIYERLASNIVDQRHPLSLDLESRLAEAPLDAQIAVENQVDDRIHQAMQPEVESLECLAIHSYVRAMELAQPESIATDASEAAESRLLAFSEERRAACAEPEPDGAPEVAAGLGE